MSDRDLPNKPLIEAIFELRWEMPLVQSPREAVRGVPELRSDPNYKLLLGKLAARIEDRFPFYEALPTASVPDEMVGYVIQHRFRSGEATWPLVQVGPGLLTYNETDKYLWESFEIGVRNVVSDWRSSYPAKRPPQTTHTALKYIDAVAYDYTSKSALDLLEKLKISVRFEEQLISAGNLAPQPASLLWRTSFKTSQPKGTLHLQIATATKDGEPAISWETVLESVGADAPNDDDALNAWLNQAHQTTSMLFFQMIEGELHEQFRQTR